MSELKTNLEQILQEKTTKLIPENIKRKVEIFDVTGTDGDAEVEELQAKIIETRQEIADTRRDLENSAATVTGTGENVTLNQTAEATLKKLGVGGNSKQETTEGKNLANSNEMIQGYWAYADGDFVRVNTWICTPKIECSGNTAYTYQFSNASRWSGFVFYDENGNYISTSNVQNGSSTEYRTYTATSPSNARYLVVNIAGFPQSTDAISVSDLINFQLEKNSTATSYEPYTNGASPNPDYPQEITNVTGDVEVVVENANIWDEENATVLYSNTRSTIQSITNGIRVTAGQTSSSAFVTTKICNVSDLIDNKITVKAYWQGTNNGRIEVGYCDANGLNRVTLAPINISGNSISVTVPEGIQDKVIIVWFYARGNANGYVDYTNIQLEYGSTATEYVEHKGQKFTFPLGNEKLMLGDYLADDGIHHVRGQGVLDGTEAWFRNDLTTGQRFTLNVTNFNFKKITSLGDDLLSNYFKGINYSAYYSTGGISGVSYNYYYNINYLQIFLKENYTLNEFKTWLQTKYNNNTPVIVEYELQEEVIVPYTSAQQEVYNQIKQALSYEGQTNVIGSSGGSNPIFTVTAFRDADLVITSLDNQLTLKE